ncbi:hypothetical protein QZH41_018563 [Actinostola sp. cb2023]|nr:hypothetical protein QZH41_018563 [Actinostola sp. cb2023]
MKPVQKWCPKLLALNLRLNEKYKALQRFKRDFDDDSEDDSNPYDNKETIQIEPEVRRFKRKMDDDDDDEEEDSSGNLSRILDADRVESGGNSGLYSGNNEPLDGDTEEEHTLRRYKRKALDLDEMDELGKALSSSLSSSRRFTETEEATTSKARIGIKQEIKYQEIFSYSSTTNIGISISKYIISTTTSSSAASTASDFNIIIVIIDIHLYWIRTISSDVDLFKSEIFSCSSTNIGISISKYIISSTTAAAASTSAAASTTTGSDFNIIIVVIIDIHLYWIRTISSDVDLFKSEIFSCSSTNIGISISKYIISTASTSAASTSTTTASDFNIIVFIIDVHLYWISTVSSNVDLFKSEIFSCSSTNIGISISKYIISNSSTSAAASTTTASDFNIIIIVIIDIHLYWISTISSNVDLFKSMSCDFPLGMQNGAIQNEQLTSSSDFSKYHTAARGRVGTVPDANGQAGGWCAGGNHINQFQYLQLHFGQRRRICRVATQGMAEFPIWVTGYSMEFSNNGHIWADYTEEGHQKTFLGNTDSTTTVSHSLKQPITARYVRFKPRTWDGASICMRAEVYASKDPELTSRDHISNGLVAYLNFDRNDDGGDLDKRTRISKESGACGNVASLHHGGSVLLDAAKIQPKPRDAITIAAWIRLDNTKGQHSIFDTIGGHSSHDDGQYHFEVSDGKLRWYHRNETANRIFSVESDAVISSNKWTHVAGTYDAHTGLSKVFIDGHMNAESQGSGLLSQDWDSHAGIGRHKDSRFLDGQVDEFRIYNYEMKEDDIRKLMKTCNYNKVPRSCGGSLIASEGSIQSPNWPNGYKGAKRCTWSVTVGQRDTIALKFNSFNLQEDGNCDRSKLVVKDGDNENAKELGEFCGLNSPSIIRSRGHQMWLQFKSNEEGEGKGFRLTYRTEGNPQSKKEERPHPVKNLKCSASTAEQNVTLVGGIKAGSFSEALGVLNLDICMRQCCLKKSCDLAFMISKSCYLVDCLNEELCKTKKARTSSMNPTVVYINHLKEESAPDTHTGLSEDSSSPQPRPTPKASQCHHTDVSYNVTLVGGIKAGKFSTYGHMNNIDDCIRHCCHDDNCDVAFMIQNNCYNVECDDRLGCQMKKAKSSPYNPTLAYVYRGDNKPVAEPIKKHAKPSGSSCNSLNVTPTMYNVTLIGGVKSGKFTDKGMVNNMDDCKAYCCAEDSCNVAFLIRTNCFLVTCKDYETCKVKQAMSDYYHPKLAFINWNPPDDEVRSDEKFASLGCWRDAAVFAVPSLEAADPALMESYNQRMKPIDTCASVAYKRGYKVFAIQNGGACFSGANADETFNKFGESSDCKNGRGGMGANDVYRLNYDGSYSNIGCWRDTDSRALAELEHKDSRLNDAYQSRTSPAQKCADAARQQGYPVFALQDGGRCMSGPAAEDSYKTYGISRDCHGSVGGSYANSVYKLIGNFDLPDEETQNNTADTNGVAMNSANTGSPSKPIEETGQTKQVVGEDSSVPAKTATTSMREDFVTMKNGQPERIVYTAGRIHYNQTLKYGIKSGKFMDKGKVVNISQCISACGRQPDCDVAFMLGTQCYAVSCHTKTLCLTKPAYSAFYNPVIVFVTKRKVFSVVKTKQKRCHVSEIQKSVTLVGGINAGKFMNLGQTSDMNYCIKRCCAKATCDVAFLLEAECYGVSCLSNQLCKTRKAKNPWRYRPQIAYIYHDEKGLDSKQGSMEKETSGLASGTLAPASAPTSASGNSSPVPTHATPSVGLSSTSSTGRPSPSPTVHVQHSCIASPIKYNVTLRMGLHSGLFTKMGRVDSMDDCIELNCKQMKTDVAFMMGTHCFSVQCYSEDLCKTEPVFATSLSFLNLRPAVSFLKKNPGVTGSALALQVNPRESCLESSITYNVTLRGGIHSGKFVERPHVNNMRACIGQCCDASSCDLAFMFGTRCYSVTCKSEKDCQAVLAKPTNLHPRISYMTRISSGNSDGVSLAEDENIQPRCHADDMTKTAIARNKTLVGGLEAGTFKFLGKVKTMSVCMRKCCARPKCDLAYLIDKNCFSVRCFSHELCKISTSPSITSGDVEISAMRKTIKKEELPEDTHSVVVYIIVGTLMFAAGLGGIVWAVCMFMRR